ncbi:DUF6527 family protein [Parasphingorhabdus sp.]|uniref:DUF6527 family protein n=1 Tax=Parasphingorhabdus sp. TaxID=2709688 RepID=UPI003A8D0E79
MSAAGSLMRKTDGGYLIWCPGCGEPHIVAVEKPLGNGASWSFDGNLEKPTFSPSLLVMTGSAVDPNFKDEPDDPPTICHSFIRNGNWEYCSDSKHALSGQTVPVPPWPTGD